MPNELRPTNARLRGSRTTRVVLRAATVSSLFTLALAAACEPAQSFDEESIGATKQRVSSPNKVLVNQLGYPSGATKIAVIVDSATSPMQVEVISASNAVVFGPALTTVKSADVNSGDAVHHFDFSAFTSTGTGYKVRISGTSNVSGSFAVGPNVYGDNNLGKAAMKYFYWKRSGMATSADSLFNITAHGVGHGAAGGSTGDAALVAYGNWRSGTFDVAGGWYDAGDHSKYLESHTAATFYLGNMFERMKAVTDFAGNKLETFNLGISESTSTYPLPDILDELAWGTRWVRGALPDPTLHKTAPARTDMAANKCASESWPAYPGQYETDSTPRKCMGPSTSATHSAARNMAMVARLLQPFGAQKTNVDMDGTTDLSASAYADKLWFSAKEAFGRVTGKHPDHSDYTGAGATNLMVSDINWSESPGFNQASGPYQDDDMRDDEYAAAVELYLTACQRNDAAAVAKYKALVTGHTYYKQAGPCDWGTERPLGDADGEERGCGTLSLVSAHDQYCSGTEALPSADLTAMRSNLKTYADALIANMNGQNYPSYTQDGGQVVWGSNGAQAGAIVMLTAVYQSTLDTAYLKAANRMMDYLLGVNPMKTSYIIGFGQYAATATHDRVMNHSSHGKVFGTLVGGPLNINGNDPSLPGDSDNLAGSQKDPATPKQGRALKRFANTSGDGGSSWESEENAVNWGAALASAAWGLQVYSDDMGGGGSSCVPADCNDNNPCTTDVCNSGSCSNTAVSNGTACSDGNSATCDDVCTSGTCAGGSCGGGGDDPRVVYDFNETSGTTAADSSGNGLNATLSGASFGTGFSGNGVRIAGGTQRVNLPANVVQNCTDATGFTIAARVKLATNSTNWSRIFDIGQGTSNYLFLSPRAGGSSTLRFAMKVNNGGEQMVSYSYSFPTNVWKHVAVTLSGNTARLYLDGTQVASNTNFSYDPAGMGATANNWLGDSQYSADPTLDGTIDDFRLACRAYSDSEISTLAGGGGGCSSAPAAPGSPGASSGAEQVSPSWTASSGATSYTVRRSTTSGGSYSDVATNLTATSFVNSVAAGTYYYVVAAVNSCGTSSNSAQVSGLSNNVLPTVNISSPSGGASFTAPAGITINANAADTSFGSINRVEFYQGSTLLGTDSSSPYSYAWTGVLAGSYSLTAKAIDNLNGSTTSNAVAVSVTSGGGGGGGPCDTLCSSPTVFTTQSYSSGNLGTGAVCHEYVGSLGGANFGNFVAPRALSVNGVSMGSAGGNIALPAPRNGGYCFQAPAGEWAWAYFGTW